MIKRVIFRVGIILVIIFLIGYIERAWLFRIALSLLQKIDRNPVQIQTTEVEFLSGNLHLWGTIYTPATSFGQYPAIVICHGGTKLGRKLALFIMMARTLAARGYVVLTFDFRGFGDSEDPHKFETFSDLDFVQDVSSALTYLSELKQVDTSKFYVVGHSFGAGVAVAAGLRDFRVKKVVSIAPGRGTKERFYGENAPDPDYPSSRISEDMKIRPPIPKDILDPHLKDYVAEVILDYPVHPPVLLVDGEHESEEDLAFLRDVYEQMSEPKGYVTIQSADHYFGTKREQDGSSGNIHYNETIINELVDAIDHWFREE
jgi:alpha/beta superfamily hydrolase